MEKANRHFLECEIMNLPPVVGNPAEEHHRRASVVSVTDNPHLAPDPR
ncbi:hypothetical protein SAMN05192558_10412 [Actinokineospora alba]|uniref:Uncharacterized protein n=1 Tax=Actinokineospora alba TaxID=504798 RepID=A0A1H0L541_9PSEU|nr:hypothetical protein C8E96_2731 [Actinokineospora alba]SDJ04578.1 hypothetical protein SAMN05421871_109287 [Actinokineospora alba]SDO63195.1 hypothetical protein SAMN05192558_10412 [Actinokineospora alba]